MSSASDRYKDGRVEAEIRGCRDHIESVRTEAARRSDARDAEFAAIKEVLADHAARIGNSEKASDRAPQWTQVVAVAFGFAGLAGGAAQYAIWATAAPVRQSFRTLQERIDHEVVEAEGERALIRQKQDDSRERQAASEAEVKMLTAELRALEREVQRLHGVPQ